VTARRKLSPRALLCALVLAPSSLSRNRFFSLYEVRVLRRARRRATRVRSLVRVLAGHGKHHCEITGERVLDDGRVLIRYRIPQLDFQGTSALSDIEASVLRYALHRAGLAPLPDEDRTRVEEALLELG
jgi:hypothetical protein